MGARGRVSHLSHDRKQIWKFWPICSMEYDSRILKTHFISLWGVSKMHGQGCGYLGVQLGPTCKFQCWQRKSWSFPPAFYWRPDHLSLIYKLSHMCLWVTCSWKHYFVHPYSYCHLYTPGSQQKSRARRTSTSRIWLNRWSWGWWSATRRGRKRFRNILSTCWGCHCRLPGCCLSCLSSVQSRTMSQDWNVHPSKSLEISP